MIAAFNHAGSLVLAGAEPAAPIPARLMHHIGGNDEQRHSSAPKWTEAAAGVLCRGRQPPAQQTAEEAAK